MGPPILSISNELADMVLGELSTGDLYSMSLVSRPLYHLSLPFLYRRYVNLKKDPDDGEFSSLRSHWPFLRTLLSRPELGLLVREVKVAEPLAFTFKPRNGTFPLSSYQPTNEEERLLAQAFEESQLIINKRDQQNRLYQNYGEPYPWANFAVLDMNPYLILPLLFRTPNLEALKILGPFESGDMSQVFRYTVDAYTPPTSRMRKLHTYIEKDLGFGDWDLIRNHGRVMSLPKMQTLAFGIGVQKLELEPFKMKLLQKHGSNIQDLTVQPAVQRHPENSLPRYLYVVQELVQSFRGLKRLSYENSDHDSPSATIGFIISLLRPHQDTLTRIVIDRFKTQVHCDFPQDLNLSQFRNLRDVVIQDMYIVSRHESIFSVPPRLPQHIQTLRLITKDILVTLRLLTQFHHLNPRRHSFFTDLRFCAVEIGVDEGELYGPLFYEVMTGDARELAARGIDAELFVRIFKSCIEMPQTFDMGWGFYKHKRAIFARLRELVLRQKDIHAAEWAWISFSPRKEWYSSPKADEDPDDVLPEEDLDIDDDYELHQ